MNVSVIGLGKVGLSLASCLATSGHRVIGVEIDVARVDALNRDRFDTSEPGVAERLSTAPAGAFTATSDLAAAICGSDLSFVIVPTPSNTLGGFSLRFLLPVCDAIGAALRKGDRAHTIAVVSTMLPGSSDAVVIPRLEAASGRTIGRGLGYCYNPSFIALGEVVKGIVKPDYVLIGEADRASGDLVQRVHESMVTTTLPVARMTPVEAEITKIASNTHETMRVSFANMLLSICSEIPGADVDRITEALAYRMGRRFFRGALPYGGPCWPRDNVAFTAFIDAIRSPSTLPRAVDTFNAEHGRYVLRKILSVSAPGQTVGLLGLAYKPGTPVTERAFALDLAAALPKDGRKVIAWDPVAISEFRKQCGDGVAYADSAEACLRASQVAVATIPLADFASIDWTAAANTTLVDGWRCLPRAAIDACREYVALGRGPSGSVAPWLRDTVGAYFDLLTS
jgi:UDPglucose 6-dehydrogenase